MANTIQFSAIVDGVTLKKDSTLSIRLGTQEMTPEESAEVFKMGNRQIWVGLCETGIAQLDIPKEINEFENDKSPSERLRNVLWVYWKENMKGEGEFETFRKGYMNKIIDNIKEKLK